MAQIDNPDENTENPNDRLFDEGVIRSEDFELTNETTCGIWILKGSFLQKFANKKAYVFLYGFAGCICSACYAYFNGTISTLEKRFKIPSRTTGLITIGNDLSQLLVSMVLSYYTGKGHRPRWMAVGLYTMVLFCLLTALPHWLYGPGEDALSLTTDYGAKFDDNITRQILNHQLEKTLCSPKGAAIAECERSAANHTPQLILFLAQVVSGIGGSLYHTLGISYMDDNIKKSKTAALISVSYFLNMLGPAFGYALASFCLKFYISPTLTTTITRKDPRWLGAWWLGWVILGIPLALFALLLSLFPKTLPRAAARKRLLQNQTLSIKEEQATSFKDMVKTFKRLCYNPILMMNNFAAIFYFLGYMPYWLFLPKYIESQYRQSASASSLITGTASLIFSAIGILLSGLVITKYKPKARCLSGWNVMVGVVSVLGIVSYAFLGCIENDTKSPLLPTGELNSSSSCNRGCSCDYVKYDPVCSENGKHTFISPCHAGCKKFKQANNSRIYYDCSCVRKGESDKFHSLHREVYDKVTPGACPIDCYSQFYSFLAVVCLLKFSAATGRASNFLVTVRCVEERDKPSAMGFGLMMTSLCAFIPSPILFGVILDRACLVWGKTCTGNGNCWLYNSETLRRTMNFTAASFVAVGTLFDLLVWFFVKDLKIFDENEDIELKDI